MGTSHQLSGTCSSLLGGRPSHGGVSGPGVKGEWSDSDAHPLPLCLGTLGRVHFSCPAWPARERGREAGPGGMRGVEGKEQQTKGRELEPTGPLSDDPQASSTGLGGGAAGGGAGVGGAGRWEIQTGVQRETQR